MSYNAKRRLQRQAIHAAGHRTDTPRSGRRRGRTRHDAARDVVIVNEIFKARAKHQEG